MSSYTDILFFNFLLYVCLHCFAFIFYSVLFLFFYIVSYFPFSSCFLVVTNEVEIDVLVRMCLPAYWVLLLLQFLVNNGSLHWLVITLYTFLLTYILNYLHTYLHTFLHTYWLTFSLTYILSYLLTYILIYILILSSHLCLGRPSVCFPSDFPTKTLYTPLLVSHSATCPAPLILLELITH